MRTVEQTTQFKRDLKRESRGQHRATLARDFVGIVEALAKDEPLADRHHDHSLAGEWKDHRDCHIRPDLVLIYSKPRPDVLYLVRIGSHSALGL